MNNEDYEALQKSWNRLCMIWTVNGQCGFTEYDEGDRDIILRQFSISSFDANKLIKSLDLKSTTVFKTGTIWTSK